MLACRVPHPFPQVERAALDNLKETIIARAPHPQASHPRSGRSRRIALVTGVALLMSGVIVSPAAAEDLHPGAAADTPSATIDGPLASPVPQGDSATPVPDESPIPAPTPSVEELVVTDGASDAPLVDATAPTVESPLTRGAQPLDLASRSEERRVGKECPV